METDEESIKRLKEMIEAIEKSGFKTSLYYRLLQIKHELEKKLHEKNTETKRRTSNPE